MLAAIKKYSPEAVEFIFKMLQNHVQSGRKPQYEVWVDNLPIVPRTDNLEMFHTYSNHISGDSRELKIISYQGKSNHNDKYIFRLGDETVLPQVSLNGTEQMQSFEGILNQRLQEAEQRWEQQRLVEKLESIQKEQQESEKYIEALESKVKKYEEEEKSSLFAGLLGTFGGKLVDSAIENSTRFQGLFGNGLNLNAPPEKQEPTQVQFRPKTDDPFGKMAEQMRKDFNEEEFKQVSRILYYLSKQKQDITSIHDMLYNNEK